MRLLLCVFSFLLALLSSSMEAPLLRGEDLEAEEEGEGEGREERELIHVTVILETLRVSVDALEAKVGSESSAPSPSLFPLPHPSSPSQASLQHYMERTPLFYRNAPDDVRGSGEAGGEIGATFRYLCDHNLGIAKEVLERLREFRGVQRKEELFKRYQQQLRALAWAFIDFDSEKIRRVRAELFGLELLAARGVKEAISVRERETLQTELFESLGGKKSVLADFADRHRVLAQIVEMDYSICAFLLDVLPQLDHEKVERELESRETYAVMLLAHLLYAQASPAIIGGGAGGEENLCKSVSLFACFTGRKDSASDGELFGQQPFISRSPSSSSFPSVSFGASSSTEAGREEGGEEDTLQMERRKRKAEEEEAERRAREYSASQRARWAEKALQRLSYERNFFVDYLKAAIEELEAGKWKVPDLEEGVAILKTLAKNVDSVGRISKWRSVCGFC